MMLISKKRCDSRWAVWLCIIVSSFTVTWCYNSCPHHMKDSDSTLPPSIPDEAVEQAIHEARHRVHMRTNHEIHLMNQGRVIPKSEKTSESTHPQANQKPIILQMEMRQRILDEATRILTQRFKLSREQVACGLPLLVLTEYDSMTEQQRCLHHEPTIECDNASIYRTADGTCNNLEYPIWGRALSPYARILPAVYSDDGGFRQSVKCGPLPSPRTISLNIHSGSASRWDYKASTMYVFFGQVLDHDLTFTAQSVTENNLPLQCCTQNSDDYKHNNYHQCAPIEISPNDPFYGRYNRTCLNFVRSAPFPSCTLGHRQQINTATSYIDLSFMYGTSLDEANSLRTFQGGQLIVQKTRYGDLLAASNLPHEDHCSVAERNLTCFRSGDTRVNQNPMLASMQTLFVREHNRICAVLENINPHWDDERLYQEARRISGAQFQAITWNEWLPYTVGYDFMIRFNLWSDWDTAYRKDLQPAIRTEFSTAAMRYGHSMISRIISESPRSKQHSGHLFRDIFFQPYELYSQPIDLFVKGATESRSESFDRYVVPDLTNYLYKGQTELTGLDLASFNVQRGRDHGLDTYTAYVEICSNKKVKSFDDLVRYHLMTEENMELLRNVYESEHDIDLWTGLLMEKHLKNAWVGPTTACIIALQFHLLKYADRFFYLHRDNPYPFTPYQLSQLRWSTSLAGIICQNTKITKIQRRAMENPSTYMNPLVDCESLPRLDLTMWTEEYTTTTTSESTTSSSTTTTGSTTRATKKPRPTKDH